MSTSLRLLVLGTLLFGCASGSDDSGGPGTDSTRSSGGKIGSDKPAATGGKVGSGGAAAAGAGGSQASGGSSGTASGGAGDADAGTGGSAGEPSDGGSGETGGPVATDPGPAGPAPYGCTGCTRLFNGTNLDGWDTVPGSWVVKPGGVLASVGKTGDIYTHEDLGDYRIFFQVRHLPPMGGKDHQPCTVLFGKRPPPMTAGRGLGGAQFQPPNGYSWDYGVGGKFTSPAGKPKLDAKAWNQCEIVVKEAGSFRAACCAVGATPCKSSPVLSWAGPGRKHPFDIMMHNAGLFDEYREIWIEKSPKEDVFLSGK